MLAYVPARRARSSGQRAIRAADVRTTPEVFSTIDDRGSGHAVRAQPVVTSRDGLHPARLAELGEEIVCRTSALAEDPHAPLERPGCTNLERLSRKRVAGKPTSGSKCGAPFAVPCGAEQTSRFVIFDHEPLI